MKKNKITIGHVFKTIIWPRRKIVLVGLVLIIISRLAGLVLPGATKGGWQTRPGLPQSPLAS